MSASEERHKRPNRSARERKEQYGRAQAKAVQLLLRNSCCLQHRGCQRTKLGEVLHHSLAAGAMLPAPYGEPVQYADAGLQELADRVRELADMVEYLVQAQKAAEAKETEGEAREEVLKKTDEATQEEVTQKEASQEEVLEEVGQELAQEGPRPQFGGMAAPGMDDPPAPTEEEVAKRAAIEKEAEHKMHMEYVTKFMAKVRKPREGAQEGAPSQKPRVVSGHEKVLEKVGQEVSQGALRPQLGGVPATGMAEEKEEEKKEEDNEQQAVRMAQLVRTFEKSGAE